MKNTKILTSAAFFALAAIALLAGCGDLDSPDGKTCKTAQDCTSSAGTKYHCVDYDGTQGTCRLACDKADGSGGDQDSCSKATEECKDYSPTKDDGTIDPNSPKVFACAPKTSTTPGDQDECTSDAQCADKGERNVCDLTTKKCIKPNEVKPKYRSVVIVDKTTDTKACNGLDDPGIDISGVALAQGDGTVVAWGKNAASAFGNGTNKAGDNEAAPGYYDVTFPSGNDPQTLPNKKECITDNLSNSVGKFVSLGCQGGFLALDFGDKALEEGVIKVFEFSNAQCGKNQSGGTGDSDRYNVYICQSKTVTTIADAERDCKLIGENQSGYVELPFPKK